MSTRPENNALPAGLRRAALAVALLAPAALALPLAPAASAAAPAKAPRPALTVHVSPHGKDTGTGTAARPFKTLAHARDHVRSVRKRVHGDIRVELADGTYRLDRTLTLDARDSGANGTTVTWAAAPGAHPVISGGERITGWQPADGDGKVFKAPIGDLRARQLYVDGAPQTRARTENEWPGGWQKTKTGYTFTDDSLTHLKRPSDLEVVSSWGWKLMRCPVESVNDHTMTMRRPCWDNANLQEGQEITTPTWLENAREFVDTPGEWYIDHAAGEVYYYPKQGQDLDRAEVTVPTVQDLVDLNGTASAPVRDVSFDGLTFSYSTWLEPSSDEGHIEGQAGFRMVGEDNPDFDSTRLHWKKTPGAVNTSFTKNVSFTGNTFTHLGAVGLNLNTGSQGTEITGNVFRQISATGIQVGGVDYYRDAHPTDTRDIVRDTTVSNNVVTRTADQYRGSLGILAGYTDHTAITHNKVYDLPYSGISVGWGWGLTDKGGNPSYVNNGKVPVATTPTTSRNTVVSYNDIGDIMKNQADGGAVYTLGANPGGRVSDNYVHGVPEHAYGAVYHDEMSRGWTNTNNAFCGVTYQWMLMNHGIENNASGNFTDNAGYAVQGGSFDNTVRNNTKVGGCAQLPASIVKQAGLEPAYRHLDPGPAVTDRTAPTRPGAPEATTDFPTVADLSWTASKDDKGVTGYSVYRDGRLVSASGSTEVRIPGLKQDTTYRFQVRARDAAGNESPYSATTVVRTPKGEDLALKHPATASSDSEGNVPAKAVDGDPGTRWAQGLGLPDPSWLQVDLGAPYDVNGAITTFEKSKGYRYRVEVSPDEVHWKPLVDRTGADTTEATDYARVGTPVTGRYVRLTLTGTSGNGGSVFDFQVYGTKAKVTDRTAPTAPKTLTAKVLLPGSLQLDWQGATDDKGVTSYVVSQDGKRVAVTGDTTLRIDGLEPGTRYAFTVTARDEALNTSPPSPETVVTTPADTNLALHKEATASSDSEGNVPAKAVDGDNDTRWAQGLGLPDPSWLQVDLGTSTPVSAVVTTFEKSGGYRYRVEYSADGKDWSAFADRTDEPTTTQTDNALAAQPVEARYLRLTVTGSSGNGGSIHEIRAYGGF
ncbi:discoidin domain-containing protein [Streptomyces sp. NPDC058426]|uniref:discoidin domain-containing protein n=1 Tax=Streptomyces sp. NPDC058426 TaxID=3346493 RepID=UPI00364D3D9D